jgi:hypothetical protein
MEAELAADREHAGRNEAGAERHTGVGVAAGTGLFGGAAPSIRALAGNRADARACDLR